MMHGFPDRVPICVPGKLKDLGCCVLNGLEEDSPLEGRGFKGYSGIIRIIF